MPNVPWSMDADGLILSVRLTPRGGRDKIDGIAEDGAHSVLKVRVSAPPVNGAANAALIKFLSKSLGCPKSSIELVSGDTARIKRLRLSAPDMDAALRALL